MTDSATGPAVGDGPPAGAFTALIEEAAKKSGVLWLDLPGSAQPRAAWHVWHDGAAYVLTGGEGEQPMPGLPESGQVRVTMRSKDKGGRLITWIAAVEPVDPGSPLWDEVTPVLAKARLNAVDGGEQAGRWATESYVMRLVPTGEALEAPGAYRDGDDSVRPAPTPATTTGRTPLMFGAKRRKADR